MSSSLAFCVPTRPHVWCVDESKSWSWVGEKNTTFVIVAGHERPAFVWCAFSKREDLLTICLLLISYMYTCNDCIGLHR